MRLAQEDLGDRADLLASPDERLADRRRLTGLRPGLDEIGRLARLVRIRRIDRVDEEPDRDRQLVGGRAATGQAVTELAEASLHRQRARGQEQLVLAGEVGVDRADRQAARPDHVLHRRAVIALVAEHADGRPDDPVPDVLLVGGADSWQLLPRVENERSL